MFIPDPCIISPRQAYILNGSPSCFTPRSLRIPPFCLRCIFFFLLLTVFIFYGNGSALSIARYPIELMVMENKGKKNKKEGKEESCLVPAEKRKKGRKETRRRKKAKRWKKLVAQK